MKLALGASRYRIVRQLFFESLLVAIGGALIGVGVSWWTLDLLLSLAPAETPRLSEVVIDWRVLLFALGLSLVAAVVFGLIPALKASDSSLANSLRDTGTKGTGGKVLSKRFRAWSTRRGILHAGTRTNRSDSVCDLCCRSFDPADE